MRQPINFLVEQQISQLSDEQERKMRKFIARYKDVISVVNVSKHALHKSIIYRQHFLNELDERFRRGDMQFLSNNLYGYVRNYIKSYAKNFMGLYIIAKKRMLL
jgi:hypothetical protein